MRVQMTRVLCSLALGVAMASTAAFAQHGEGHSLPPQVSEPIALYEAGLGTFTRPISSTHPEAQAFFDQGFQLMYAFARAQAVRSFREAWMRDPDCAICYWGEAWAWGSYLNRPMTAEDAPHAYAAIQNALSLKDRGSPWEQAFIEAMAVRYVRDFDPATRVEQDRAYAEAMRQVSEAYPDDLDAATLYADALFLLEPRRGRRDIDSPSIRRLHGVLERVLAVDIRHPGACHLYVHATESTSAPEKAAACAEFLGDSIPGASHINHMPSHTWSQIGRWGDAVRGNIQAWHSDQKAAIGHGIAIYPEHNLHMLLFSASMDGQGAVAIQAAKDYATMTGDTSYHVLTLLRFGRFDEILAVADRPQREIQAGLWDFARGYAHLRQGDVDFAKAYLARVRRAAETSDAMFRVHSAKNLLGLVGGLLEGEIQRDAGDPHAALAAFERAVAFQDELMWDEPEPLPFAARHWLGAALTEAGRYEDAERVYRQALEDHPLNGWSLFGLQQALAGQGRSSGDVDRNFEAAWARSDTWIRASRF